MPGDEDIIFVKEYSFPRQFIKMCAKNSSQSIASYSKKQREKYILFFGNIKISRSAREGDLTHAYQISGNVLTKSLWCLLLAQIADQ